MTGRRWAKPRTTPAGGPIVLDWRSPAHWSWTAKPCRYCGQDTNLRDSKRSPAHKVCAEAAIARQSAEAADAYRNGQL